MRVHVGYIIGAILLAIAGCVVLQVWNGRNVDADMAAKGCVQVGRDGELTRTADGRIVEGKVWLCDKAKQNKP